MWLAYVRACVLARVRACACERACANACACKRACACVCVGCVFWYKLYVCSFANEA